ncbi:hypothetical protein [Chryseobacterium sp. KMC2]|uniref:hypothetical protein n=1 Tax=Chryseobacterium sp. KMC2 TaxID=2800705 RepID=UPI0019242D3A|nr:hypothetical protein [Chryseobacterium sp. KMC2]MBL3547249.1 hypothetical protein [Chryseobacterium sp. KMC2]
MDTIKLEQAIIDLTGHKVPVLKNGLYDRFRSNQPVSVIGKERRILILAGSRPSRYRKRTLDGWRYLQRSEPYFFK